MDRRQLLLAGAAGAAALASPGLRAQGRFPTKPITIYGALPAAGVMDQHLRALGERVQKTLGQSIVIEAKPGAGATLAPQLIQNAPPDGHLLAAMTVNSLRYPYYQKTPYDPLKDFTFIIGLSNVTFGIVVNADSPYKTIDDLIAAGKAKFEGDRKPFDQLRTLMVVFHPNFEILPGTAPKAPSATAKPFEVPDLLPPNSAGD